MSVEAILAQRRLMTKGATSVVMKMTYAMIRMGYSLLLQRMMHGRIPAADAALHQ